MKRGVYGVFHNVSVKYMQKYVNELCYRLNHRDKEIIPIQKRLAEAKDVLSKKINDLI